MESLQLNQENYFEDNCSDENGDLKNTCEKMLQSFVSIEPWDGLSILYVSRSFLSIEVLDAVKIKEMFAE